MSQVSGTYNPAAIEPRIYDFWKRGGYFRSKPDGRRPFTIVIPPPNVTGALHLGHAINNTLQDILIRQKRMAGFNACWLPGTDHAGIATQAVVEKRLREEQKLTRHELGREKLVAKIWEWKEEYSARILGQLERMGCSCDWERTRFTLDEQCARAVMEVFFRWFQDGLIFRGLRLVNWDTHLQTAVADDELYHAKIKGSLWHIRYPIVGAGMDGPGAGVREPQAGVHYLVVATTRPETMLGDTAVAVHPDDDRYKRLIGGQCLLPLTSRQIPIIADGQLVKKEFGTGCVKVTPAHDPNDYQCGLRHKLAMISVLTPDGRINEHGGPYRDMPRYEARKKIVADLESQGLLDHIEPYETEVGHSDRSKTPIEPMLSEQWFVRMGQLADLACDAAHDGRVRFFPPRFAKTYLDWLGEKRDWCISRQLWWGHRIPVWRRRFVLKPGKPDEELDALASHHLFMHEALGKHRLCYRIVGVEDASTLSDPRVLDLKHLMSGDVSGTFDFCICYIGDDPQVIGLLERELRFERDPDVLDTWFSSALWPFSTFGWPQQTDDLRYYFPTNVLATAREIITLWVARMVITAQYFTGRVPFQHVHINPTIQDGEGRRMSKSAGNGVDPLDLIELYGADAMRFTLASMAGETQDVRVPVKPVSMPDGRKVNSSERFELGRNFCNKLWQAATGVVLASLDGYEARPLTRAELALEDRWILERLRFCTAEVERRLAAYQWSDVAGAIYSFFWGEFCDWYLEWVKPRLATRDADGKFTPRRDESARTARQVLAWVLDQTLRLLHPIAPFITEELWQQLNAKAPQRGSASLETPGAALIAATWPSAAGAEADSDAEARMDLLQGTIRALRDIRAKINLLRAGAKQPALRTLPRAIVKADGAAAIELQSNLTSLTRLAQCDAFELSATAGKPPEAFSRVLRGVELYVPVAGLADLELERQRLRKEADEIGEQIGKIDGKLSNRDFVAKAKADVVERERARLAEFRGKLATLEQHLNEL